jgi:cyclopropane-fatty-acyl-phospholipid synthase
MTADGTATAERQGYLGASKGAIAHHYDVGDSFLRLWLDPTMTYSCALWEAADDLERAQLRKLDYMLDRARAAGVARLLDVGCGWGSLLKRAVDRGVGTAAGLTLSEAQRDYVAGWDDPRVEVHLQGWAEFESSEPFDAIVSIGAFEHFARLGLSRDERLDSYRRFFERCHGLLRPGGRLALQTIAKGDVPVDRQGMRDILLIVKRMFPESELPYPSDVVLAAEGHFEIESMRNDRLHYARTCRAWLAALRSRYEEAVAVAGQEIVDLYADYLAACIRQFDGGHAVLLRFGMRRLDAAPRKGAGAAAVFRKERPA